jgi:glucan endo-1,3-alpha-glucosidase
MWFRRWNQTLSVLPEFVEIVTWNDYGESHYIGPIHEAGIPTGADVYVDGYSHQAWLETLPYQIAAYKNAYNAANPAPKVTSDKVIYWYRNAPASKGSTEATGNDCKSSINTDGYQTCYAVDQVLEDGIFAIVMSTISNSTAKIQIGSGVPTTFTGLSAGINLISRPFGTNETGNVTVSLSCGVTGTGPAIISQTGTANYNAYVQCAGC